MDEKYYLSVREVARRTNRTEETVRRWIWSGKLLARKLGNQYFIDPADLVAVSGGHLRVAEPAAVYSAAPSRPDRSGEYGREAALSWLRETIELGERMGAEGAPVDVTELIDEAREGLR